MSKAANVTFLQNGTEITCETIVSAIFKHMLSPMGEESELLKIYGAGTKAGYIFLDMICKQFPEVRSLLHFQPAIAEHFATMFVGGMLMKKVLDSEENNITIQIEVIEEDDNTDASSSGNSINIEESCTGSTANSSGCLCNGASEDERRTPKEDLE